MENEQMKIPLTFGKFAMVDKCDFDKLSQYKWYLSKVGYAARGETIDGKRKTIYMHRQILQTPEDKEVDHINKNKLNNCRDNIRECSRRQNNANRKLKSKTGFIGVEKKGNKYRAYIKGVAKRISIGYFENLTDAAKAYNQEAIKLFGEFATLNNV